MNVVFAKHNGNPTVYAFAVPDYLAPYIRKDMDILVSTINGHAMAKTTTGVVYGNGAEDVAPRNGAYLPLKPVISFVNKQMRDAIFEDAIQAIRSKQQYDDIPF